MRKKFLAALALLALGAAAANASVTINGKTLDKIDDIVVETTGSRAVVRESVLKVMKASDGNFRFYATRNSGEGDSVSLSESGAQYLNVSGGNTNTGVHPAVGTKRNSDGSLLMMVPSTSGKTLTVNFFDVDTNGKPSNHRSVTRTFDHNVYVTETAGGLFPNGKDGGEVFVIAAYTANSDKRPGLPQGYTSYLTFAEPGSARTEYLGKITSYFPSVSVATGDFNNDGNNEFAVIREGSGADYYMQVFPSSLSMSAIYATSLCKRDSGGDNIGGCAIVAGDFDHDGRTELAAICADLIDEDGYPTVTTFKWNGSGFNTKAATDRDEKDKYGPSWLGSTDWKRSSQVPHYGIVAEAGDLDGNGTDEIVFLTAHYGSEGGGQIYASLWGTDSNLTPSKKAQEFANCYLYGWGGTTGVDRGECNYLPRTLSLALVPVGEKLSTGGAIRWIFISQCQGGDTQHAPFNYSEGDELRYTTPIISNGTVTGIKTPCVMYKYGSSGRAMGLLPGDFYCQTVELGEPTHMVYQAERSYVAEIQTPPYHVDYVQVPFAVNGAIPAKPSVLNMSYMGSNVTYTKSQTDSSKQDVSFKTTNTMDLGVNGSLGIPLAGMAATGGYKDTATKVENATSSSEAKTTLTVSETTDATDNLVLYKTDRHVWRYPVVSEVPGKPEGKNLCFMTFSLCDTPKTIQGSAGQSSQFDDYNPIHEEGNLFSYPTKIANIPHYGERQYDLTEEQDKTTGGNTTIDLMVSESGADTNGTTTTSKKVVNGSMSVTIPIPKVLNIGAGASASYSNELTNTETFTKSYATSEKFTVSLKNSQLGFVSSNIAHLIKTQLYADAAGVMKVGFAVDLQDSNALAWRNDGMYGASPDIALVLPSRFSRYNSVIDNVTRVVWSANPDRKSAIQLRGIWFRDEAGKVTSSALVRGKKYTIEIPVYNASFTAPAQDVRLDMQLRALSNAESEDKIVIEKSASKTFSIGGWTKDTENNKAMVSFDWTVPTNVEKGDYHLYFVIDPENAIDELHENWDAAKDPGGNNVGCYPVAILEKEPEVITEGAVSVADGSNSAVTENDFQMLFRPIRADDTREWLTLAEFRDELPDAESHDVTGSDGSAGQTKDFRATAKIRYTGSRDLTNLYMDVVRVDLDGTQNRVATRFIPALFRGTEREVSFMVSPEKMKNGFFTVDITCDGVALHWPKDSGDGSSSGSGGGCDAGFGGLTLAALAALAVRKRR